MRLTIVTEGEIMGNYLPIYKQIWTSTKFNKLNVYEKLIYMYLLSSPTSHNTGIFNMLLKEIACYVDIEIETVKTSIKKMQEIGLLIYKEDKNLFYIRNMFKFAQGTIKNPKILFKTTLRQEQIIQDHELWQIFKEEYSVFYEKLKEFEENETIKEIDDS